jgi:hypothetical protein
VYEKASRRIHPRYVKYDRFKGIGNWAGLRRARRTMTGSVNTKWNCRYVIYGVCPDL